MPPPNSILLLRSFRLLGQAFWRPGVISRGLLQSPTTTCIVEVNAATPTDVSCTVPSEGYYSELFLKNGMDDDQGFNWKPCDNAPSVDGAICPGANGTW